MSLFGYPADVLHLEAVIDDWGRPIGFNEREKKAKVVEEQKLIKNEKGEEVHSVIEVHLEGTHGIGVSDRFVYINALGKRIDFRPLHYEVKKVMGTDDMKKVIVYG